MMRHVKGNVVAKCDRRPTTYNTGLKVFQQAVDLLSRAEGWESIEHGRGWKNFCPACSDERIFDSEADGVGIGFTKRRSLDDDWE
jgi:hypothetical protein